MKDLTGLKFGRLTVLEYSYTQKHHSYWLCKCDCGTVKIISSSNLVQRDTQSCGCYKKEQISIANSTHKLSKSRLYKTLSSMKARCYNSQNKSYKNYGGRGITVCDEWLHDFKAFYDWSLANGYNDNLTIDRVDVNGNYEPLNCRWVTQKIQQNNRSNNHLITYNNQTHTLSEWADILKIPASRISVRLNKLHWSIEKTFTTPKLRNQYDKTLGTCCFASNK